MKVSVRSLAEMFHYLFEFLFQENITGAIDTVGDMESSLLITCLCLLSYAHYIPLMVSNIFFFKKIS